MKTNNVELIRPSTLPKLQECRMYKSKPGSSEAAARGTALDAIIRESWMSCKKSVSLSEPWTAEDSEACNFALQHLALLSHGEFVETREEELQAVVPVDGVKAGTMDALCVAEGWLVDFKTGQIRDYRAQMAAYALACMDAYFADEWKSYLIFIDQKQVIAENWTREAAEQLVTSIVSKPQKPTLCEYCKWCGAFETCELVAESAKELTSLNLKEKPTPFDKAQKVLPKGLEELKADHAAAHSFLYKLSIVQEWAELLKKQLREQLNEQEQNPYFCRIVVAGRKVVNALALGKYWEEFGWQRILGMCSQIPLATVEKEWKEVFGDKLMPENLITSSGSSVQLRLKKLKPQTTNN